MEGGKKEEEKVVLVLTVCRSLEVTGYEIESLSMLLVRTAARILL